MWSPILYHHNFWTESNLSLPIICINYILSEEFHQNSNIATKTQSTTSWSCSWKSCRLRSHGSPWGDLCLLICRRFRSQARRSRKRTKWGQQKQEWREKERTRERDKHSYFLPKGFLAVPWENPIVHFFWFHCLPL